MNSFSYLSDGILFHYCHCEIRKDLGDSKIIDIGNGGILLYFHQYWLPLAVGHTQIVLIDFKWPSNNVVRSWILLWNGWSLWWKFWSQIESIIPIHLTSCCFTSSTWTWSKRWNIFIYTYQLQMIKLFQYGPEFSYHKLWAKWLTCTVS